MLFWEYMYDISHQPTKAKMSCSNCFATNPYKVLYRDKDYNCKDCLCEKCYTDTWGELPEPDDWNYPEELKETKPKKKKNIKLLPKKKEEEEITRFVEANGGADAFNDWEKEDKCWTCDVSVATHKTYRDALGEFELTCDKCHREEYPEEYEEEEKCNTCGKNIDDDDDDKKCGEGCPEYDEGWKETHPEEEEEKEKCDCGEELLICDSGIKLCSKGCKDYWVYSNGEKVEEEEEEKRDWWGTHGDGVVYLKYATEEYMDMNFEEWGVFEGLIDSRKKE